MDTRDLIRALVIDLKATPQHAVQRRLALGLLVGGVATFAVVMFALGLRPDLGAAIWTFPFWMKAAYTISLMTVAVSATIELGRPDAPTRPWLRLAGLPALILAGIAVVQVATAPEQAWERLLLGGSASVCSGWILALSTPVFVGLLWAFRRLAPTRLRAAGAAAGLSAAALAATLYGLHCPEASALFVLVWYSLGIVLAAAIGALLGPRLLRW